MVHMKNYTRIFGVIIFALTVLAFIADRVALYFNGDYKHLEWWHYLLMVVVSMALFTLTDKQVADFASKFISKKIDEK